MKNWKGILGKLVYMAAAAGIGFVGGLVLAQQADLGAGGAAGVFRLFWMFAAAVLAAVVQIIVHEAGHLAGGWLRGIHSALSGSAAGCCKKSRGA